MEPDDVAGNRSQPAYEATGISLGSFRIFPSLGAGAEFNSNIYARSTDVLSDLALTVTPSLRVARTEPGSSIELSASAPLRRYAALSGLNDDQFFLSGSMFREVSGRTVLRAAFDVSKSTANRGTIENGLQIGGPLRQTSFGATAGISHPFNRLTLEAAARANRTTYGTVALENGASLDQSFRDDTMTGVTVSTSYELSPRFSAVARGSFDRFNFDDSRPASNRSANASSATLGATYDLTHLLTVAGGVGVRQLNFRNSLFEDVTGLALYGLVRFYPTRLISIRLDVSQTTTTSVFDQVSAVVVTRAKSGFDYEYRRNVIVSGSAALSNEHYGAVDATSQHYSVDGSVSWRPNRTLRMTGSAGIEGRRKAVAGLAPEYNSIRVSVALSIAR